MSIDPDVAARLLLVPIAMQSAALAVTLVLVARSRAKAGAVLAREQPWKSSRFVVGLAPQAALLAIVIARPEVPVALAAVCLLLGMLLAWSTPGSEDAACGEEGIIRGWYGRSFAELEEWRLTGSHVRFRLFGEWTSAPLPDAHQARIRAKLLAACPERESRFQD